MYNDKPVRSSQLFGPWGVGAIIPFPNDESLMIAGLDRWRYRKEESFVVNDDRLRRRLGVSELRLPPDFRLRSSDRENFNLSVPAVRFPTWLYCPYCGTMKKTTYYASVSYCEGYPWKKGRTCNPKANFKRTLIPERFVVLCTEGHIDGFPVAEWVHYGSGKSYNPATCVLRRNTGSASTLLSGISYECSCGAKKTMAGAKNENALKRIGYTCSGSMPWLGVVGEENGCGMEVKVELRGASNVWYPDTRSSIFIPKDLNTPERINQILNEYEDRVRAKLLNDKIDKDFIRAIAKIEEYNEEELIEAFNNRLFEVKNDKEETEAEFRLSEYKVLSKSFGDDTSEFYSINIKIEKYSKEIRPFFSSISLIPKLKETRAFVGFSRIYPPDAKISEMKRKLRLGSEDWLPAMVVYGEGIFFEFNSQKLKEWAKSSEIINRAKKIDNSLGKSMYKLDGPVNPEYLLIHTFSHLLINQLIFESGYSSASIRERIYCEKIDNKTDMYGLLLYTASGDTEGSLGGLVRQGEPGRIENIILAAIKNAEWCSSDPICIMSSGQGPDSCNLAACYNCALVSETSCESGNILLDRGMVVGTYAGKQKGFFDSIVRGQ